jgi:hypothetical protein
VEGEGKIKSPKTRELLVLFRGLGMLEPKSPESNASPFPAGWRPTSFYPAATCDSQELVEDCSVPITNASSGPSCIETALSEFIWRGKAVKLL